MGELLKSVGQAVAPQPTTPQDLMSTAPGQAPPQIQGQGFQRWMPLLSGLGSALQTPSTPSAPLAPLGSAIGGYVSGREYNNQLQQQQMAPYLQAYQARKAQELTADRYDDLADKAAERGDAEMAKKYRTIGEMHRGGDTKDMRSVVAPLKAPPTDLEVQAKQTQIDLNRARKEHLEHPSEMDQALLRQRLHTSESQQSYYDRNRGASEKPTRFDTAVSDLRKSYENDPEVKLGRQILDASGNPTGQFLPPPSPAEWMEGQKGRFALGASAAKAGVPPDVFLQRMGVTTSQPPPPGEGSGTVLAPGVPAAPMDSGPGTTPTRAPSTRPVTKGAAAKADKVDEYLREPIAKTADRFQYALPGGETLPGETPRGEALRRGVQLNKDQFKSLSTLQEMLRTVRELKTLAPKFAYVPSEGFGPLSKGVNAGKTAGQAAHVLADPAYGQWVSNIEALNLLRTREIIPYRMNIVEINRIRGGVLTPYMDQKTALQRLNEAEEVLQRNINKMTTRTRADDAIAKNAGVNADPAADAAALMRDLETSP